MAMTIALTMGFVALVDDADFEWLNGFKWRALKQKGGWVYAVRHVQSGLVKTQLYMHREILKTKAPRVDHANGDGLDNRRFNLRACTTSQNGANRHHPVVSASGYHGVSRVTNGQNWRARIQVMGVGKHIGHFPTPEAAAQAYDAAARQHFGEFARLNFPGAS